MVPATWGSQGGWLGASTAKRRDQVSLGGRFWDLGPWGRSGFSDVGGWSVGSGDVSSAGCVPVRSCPGGRWSRGRRIMLTFCGRWGPGGVVESRRSDRRVHWQVPCWSVVEVRTAAGLGRVPGGVRPRRTEISSSGSAGVSGEVIPRNRHPSALLRSQRSRSETGGMVMA